MLKVGSAVVTESSDRKRKVSYREVEYDPDGWADATKFLPEDYDLVFVKITGKDKPLVGWSIKNKWDGLNIKGSEEILYWKRHE